MQLLLAATYNICRGCDDMHAIHRCLTAQRSGVSGCHLLVSLTTTSQHCKGAPASFSQQLSS